MNQIIDNQEKINIDGATYKFIHFGWLIDYVMLVLSGSGTRWYQANNLQDCLVDIFVQGLKYFYNVSKFINPRSSPPIPRNCYVIPESCW